MADIYWITDAQWKAVEPLLPLIHTGPVRSDDRRVLSGILHHLREGCAWRALPIEYGPYTTVFNRYNKWRQTGLWAKLAGALAESCDAPDFLERAMPDP